MSHSEEEEDEEDEGCHSSSSDTPTGSLPEVNLRTGCMPLGPSAVWVLFKMSAGGNTSFKGIVLMF